MQYVNEINFKHDVNKIEIWYNKHSCTLYDCKCILHQYIANCMFLACLYLFYFYFNRSCYMIIFYVINNFKNIYVINKLMI